jgi:hypothetical protein
VVAVDQSAVELIGNVLAAVELIAIELIAVVGDVAVQRVTAALTGTEVTVVAKKRGKSWFEFRLRVNFFSVVDPGCLSWIPDPNFFIFATTVFFPLELFNFPKEPKAGRKIAVKQLDLYFNSKTNAEI